MRRLRRAPPPSPRVRGCFLIVALWAIGAAAAAAGEDRWGGELSASTATFTVETVAAGTPIALPHRYLFVASERVTTSEGLLTRGKDYDIDYDGGNVTVKNPLAKGPLVITYQYLPFLQGEAYGAALTAANEAEELEELGERGGAASDLDITGSKTFSVSAGNDRGTEFDQSLRLAIRGNVGDVKITGDITDQSMPMDEGGGTQPLEAVDKVSVRVEGRHAAGTFGDYDLALAGRRFASYERRLTGIRGEAFYPTWTADAYGARARGRYACNEFYGQDGVQGPYQLSAREDDEILILPGTVRVWFNGVELKEGANNDYTLDYDFAQISFTVRRPVNAQDRIVVDFQYTTEEYERNIWGGETTAHLGNGALDLGILYAQEEDNKNRDRFGLTREEKEIILPRAGDDPEKARVPARDENGEPLYEYVGAGNGSYQRIWDPGLGLYTYNYVGPGQGEYDPRTILLPMPKRQNLVDLTAAWAPTRLFSLQAEGATSSLDANTFSPLADDDNIGLAGTTILTLRPSEIKPLARAGTLEIVGTVEARDQDFHSLGREDSVAFLETWDLADETAGLATPPAYNLYEAAVTEKPARDLSFSGTFGMLTQDYKELSVNNYRHQNGRRYAAAASWKPARAPNITYDWNAVRRRGERGVPPEVTEPVDFDPSDYIYVEDTSEYREQNGLLSYNFWHLGPYLRGFDRKRATDRGRDGVVDSGTLDRNLEAGTSFRPAAGWDLKYGHTEGWGRIVTVGAFEPYYRSHAEEAATSYHYPELLDLSLEYNRTHADYLDGETPDATSDLGLATFSITPLRRALAATCRYQLETGQDWEEEEYFEIAEGGDGDYRRVPDPRNPSRFVFIYDPESPDAIYIKRYRTTGFTYRVTKPDLTVDVGLKPFILNDARPREEGRARWLDAAALDLYLHAHDESTDPDRGAVAAFGCLLGPKSVDAALEQRYTATILPVNKLATIKARYSRGDTLDRTIASRAVRDGRISKYGELKTNPLPRVNLQADVERVRERETVTEENVATPAHTTALEMIYGLLPAVDITGQLQLKARAQIERRHEDYNGQPTTLRGMKLKPEVIYRLPESGVVDCWYQRERNEYEGYLGSETTLTRLPGVTHTWEGSVDKGVGKYVTIILTYNGEKRPTNEPTRHAGRVDLNIYF